MSLTKHPAYKTWAGMISRCHRPYATGYANYGGRGIKVCARWRGENGFVHFVEDMWPKPTPAHTLDRKNNDKGYCKSNCRWATKTQQTQGRRNIHWLTFDGETLPLAVWAERLNISRRTIRDRLSRGWSVERTLSTPRRKQCSYRVRTKNVERRY